MCSTVTVFGSINKNDMASLPVIVPTLNVMHQFEGSVAPINAAIQINYEEICILQTARDEFLSRSMSGKLSVTDIQTLTMNDVLGCFLASCSCKRQVGEKMYFLFP